MPDCGVSQERSCIRPATRPGSPTSPDFPNFGHQQQQQWTLQRAGWPVVTPVVDTSLAFPPKLMRTRSPTHPALFLAPPCLFLLTLYLLVCFRATEILIESTLIRTSLNDILAQKWCMSESTSCDLHLVWATKCSVEFWIRPPEFPIFWVLKTGTFAVFLKSMNETLTQNQNMTTAILVCCKFHLILRWLYITLNTNITIFK